MGISRQALFKSLVVYDYSNLTHLIAFLKKRSLYLKAIYLNIVDTMKYTFLTRSNIVMLFVLCYACQNDTNQVKLTSISTNDSVFVIDLDNAQSIDINYSHFFSNTSAIVLESKTECLIGFINKMRVWKNYFILLDSNISQGVFVFDKHGNFIRKIGSIGQGVGEYVSVNDFTIVEKEEFIYLLDIVSQRIHIYSLATGDFIKSVNLNKRKHIRCYHIYVDDDIYTDSYFYESSKNNYLLQKIDTLGLQVSKYLNVSDYNKGWSNLFYVENEVFLQSESKDLIFVVQQFMDTIVTIQRKKMFPYAVVKSNHFITNENLTSINKNTGNQLPLDEITNKNKYWNIHNIIEYNHYLYLRCWRQNYLISILYDKNKKETFNINHENNDVLYTEKVQRGIPMRYLHSNKDGVYAFVRIEDMNTLIEYSKEGLLNLPSKQINILNKTKEDSNPVIIYYEYKK